MLNSQAKWNVDNSSHVHVTFIVTSYNKASYLRSVLDSVWTEVCATHGQLILIDDGSSDGSDIICAEFANQHPGIIFYNQINRGIFRTLNSVVSIAKGDWVRFCDSDDPLIPGSTKRLIQVAEKSDAPICYGRAILYGPKPLTVSMVQGETSETRGKAGVHKDGASYLLNRMEFTPSRAVYRSSDLAQAFPLPSNLITCQDLAISLATALDRPIAWLDEPVCFYLHGVPNQLAANRVLMWHQIARIARYYGPRLQEHHRRAALIKAVHRAKRFTRRSSVGPSRPLTYLWLLHIRACICLGIYNFEKSMDKISGIYESELEPIIKGQQRVY